MSEKTVQAGRYRHYKGKEYLVYGVATHSETGEQVVTYRCLYGDYSLWVRPLTMFLEYVLINNHRQPRFTLIDSTIPDEY